QLPFAERIHNYLGDGDGAPARVRLWRPQLVVSVRPLAHLNLPVRRRARRQGCRPRCELLRLQSLGSPAPRATQAPKGLTGGSGTPPTGRIVGLTTNILGQSACCEWLQNVLGWLVALAVFRARLVALGAQQQ